MRAVRMLPLVVLAAFDACDSSDGSVTPSTTIAKVSGVGCGSDTYYGTDDASTGLSAEHRAGECRAAV